MSMAKMHGVDGSRPRAPPNAARVFLVIRVRVRDTRED